MSCDLMLKIRIYDLWMALCNTVHVILQLSGCCLWNKVSLNLTELPLFLHLNKTLSTFQSSLYSKTRMFSTLKLNTVQLVCEPRDKYKY